MGRPFNRVEGPGAAAAVTPRHSRRSGAVDLSTLPFLPLTTQTAAGSEVVLPGRRPDCPPRAGDTLHPRNNAFTEHGGMS